MSTFKRRRLFQVLALVASLVVVIASATELRGGARTVEVVTLCGSAVASVMMAVTLFRDKRR
jgi:hypothetical protein